MTNVIMPQMGESVTEGLITSWYKKPGDWVEKDEPLVSITTDKVDADVPAPESGYLTGIAFDEGTTVAIDTVIATISANAQETSTAQLVPSTTTSSTLVSVPVTPTPSHSRKDQPLQNEDAETLRRTRSSPLVRKMAAAHHLDLQDITGSGISGRVTKADLQRHLIAHGSPSSHPDLKGPLSIPEAASPASSAPAKISSSVNKWAYRPTEGDRIEPFTPMRSSIADHMIFSRQTSAHVTTVFEIDMTPVARLRKKHGPTYESKGAKLSFMPFILKAVTEALALFPVVNSAVVDHALAYRKDINLGVAVAVKDGLLVPVIRNADERSILGLARALNDVADRARNRKISPDELAGGTFTITNPGVFGSLFGTPIINQPQVAILCVGTITKRPVVTDDDAIAIRHMMYLALSFDHRVIDGATGDLFMKAIKDRLEAFPEELL